MYEIAKSKKRVQATAQKGAHPISRRTFVGAGALLSITAAASLSGCGETNASATDLTFVLDYTPNTNHIGLYVAQEKGYFSDEGLSISFVQPPDDGADVLVASGKAQLGMSFQDWMATYLGSFNPLPVTAVAAVIQHNTSGIMSRVQDNITRPANMSNTRYGTLDVATEQAIVKEMVDDDGGSYDSITLVSANTTDEVSGLKADQFDDVWVFEGWGLQNAYIQDYPVNYFSIASQNEVFDYYTPLIIANNTFLQEHPDVVQAFLRAAKKGYTYAAEHADDAADILLEAVPELDENLVRTSARYLSDKFIADAGTWGVFDSNRWNRFYEWMNNHGLTEQPIPLDTGFSNDYLPAVDES